MMYQLFKGHLTAIHVGNRSSWKEHRHTSSPHTNLSFCKGQLQFKNNPIHDRGIILISSKNPLSWKELLQSSQSYCKGQTPEACQSHYDSWDEQRNPLPYQEDQYSFHGSLLLQEQSSQDHDLMWSMKTSLDITPSAQATM